MVIAWRTAAWTAQALGGGKLPALDKVIEQSRMARGAERTQADMTTALTNILGKPRPASPEALAAYRRPQEANG